MRYRFRGLIRETGKPVDGHVEAEVEEEAFNALAENGIVTEALFADPKPNNFLGRPQQQKPKDEFTDALDSAFDSSATQIPFDALTDRFKGKSVWVIDREKIRRRVAQVVDLAIAQSQQAAEGSIQTRARVAQAIEGLFRDNRNITSEASKSSAALEQQIARLGNVIKQAEGVLAQMKVAIARGGSWGGGGGGGGGGRRMRASTRDEAPNKVLFEILKTNLELRGITPPPDPDAPPPPEPVAAAAEPAPAGANPPE